MSQLFERDKKSKAAFVLFFLFGRGKGVAGLLGLAALVFGLTSMPSGGPGRVPWASRLARKLGLTPTSQQDSSNMVSDGGLGQLLRRARAGRILGWKWARGGTEPGAAASNGSSLDLLKESLRTSPEAAIPARRGGDGSYDVIEGGGASVNGILNPDDVRRRPKGVTVDSGELEEGLVRPAYGGVFSSIGIQIRPGMFARPGVLSAAVGAGAWKAAGGAIGSNSGGAPGFNPSGSASGLPVTPENGTSGSSALDPGSQLMANAFNGAMAPSVGAPRQGGHLAGFSAQASQAKVGQAMGQIQSANPGTAFYQLAEGRAVSLAAVSPECPAGNGCPAEFASVSAGAEFSGTKIGDSGVLSAPELGDTSAAVPGAGTIQSSISQAARQAADAQKCEAAEAQYGPQQAQLLSDYNGTSQQMKTLNCPGQNCLDFGCMMGAVLTYVTCGIGVFCPQKKQCRSLAQKMKSQCLSMAQLSKEESGACPYSTQGSMMTVSCQ